MINKLKEYVNASKYTKWYIVIINNAIGRGKFKLCEKHHIVPKSIWKDGAKRKDNIVHLTAKEHYICHHLLSKMMISKKDSDRMHSAFWLMMNTAECKVSSSCYQFYKHKKSSAMSIAWASGMFDEVVKRKQWFYESEEQKQANREKALAEMQDPDRKASFVEAGKAAGKLKRDKDTKAWVSNSMGSDDSRAKAKAANQTDAHREACSKRELSKSIEQRITLAKQGQQALVAKLGGEEEYRKMLSDRIKGRKKYIDSNGSVRVLREPIEGFILLSEHKKRSSYVYI